MASQYRIRVIGDPILRRAAAEVTDIDGQVAKLAGSMLETMYEAPGIGLAAPQIGVAKRVFVYDLDPEERAEPKVVVNPRIAESSGEWLFDEGCLSIPGLKFDIVRPKQVLMTGWDLDGNEVAVEADELAARLFQHELDHLDGVLMTERMDPDTRREALAQIRALRGRWSEESGPGRVAGARAAGGTAGEPPGGGLSFG